jgi:hypothetical protein
MSEASPSVQDEVTAVAGASTGAAIVCDGRRGT